MYSLIYAKLDLVLKIETSLKSFMKFGMVKLKKVGDGVCLLKIVCITE